MPRRTLIIFGSLALAAVLVVGAAAAFVLRTPAASSGEITAIPVEPTAVVVAGTAAPINQSSGSGTTFEIVQTESEARFIIGEVLNGSPKTVVGVTNQVAGQIVIDPTNPASVELGVMQVNARTLTTDSGNRNRAIQNLILNTGNFEFVSFTPKSTTGLPASVSVGDTFSFQVIGDLTIRDITQEVTFDVTVTVESESRITGLAKTEVSRGDFDLVIPRVPNVASVEELFDLELEFVAVATN